MLELEGSLGLKSVESALMELVRVLLTITDLEKMGEMGNRQAWLRRGAAHRANLEGRANIDVNSFSTCIGHQNPSTDTRLESTQERQ